MNRSLCVLLLAALLLGACAPGPPAETPAPPPAADLYVAIVWHQHQPFYAVDPATGLVQAPWVRLHAAKDYVDMATMLENYPDVHATFNLTPSLIRQLDALAAGQRDLAWEMTLVPAEQLTEPQKAYLLDNFFSVNGKIIARFPRFAQLADMRADPAAWTAQDYRDLQVLFNLAWTDPDYLARPPLDALVAAGRNFSEPDKQTVLDVHLQLIQSVIATHAALQQSGQIEITTTPYAHPILPLLIDSNLASVASPELALPQRFAYGRDAVEQLERGVAFYTDHFGQPPNGMWPAEGAVAQDIVGAVYRAGLQWILTDEGVLANSLDLDFARDAAGVPANAAALYRPYRVADRADQPVTIFFRDTTLSNRVSFDYSNLPADQAVDDFLGRLRAIRDSLRGQEGGPFLVTVILDGENAWEYYDNDGKEFLNGLYAGLSADASIRAVTPTEFLRLAGPEPQTIASLWAGSWDNATFETWIGEPEENKAWKYLGDTRAALDQVIRAGTLSEAQQEQAMQAMLAAEGSDWFWWYGGDKDSGNDLAFDSQFRETLGQVYDAIDAPRPAFLRVPIIYPAPVEADLALSGTNLPAVDGIDTLGEWDLAGRYTFPGQQPAVLTFGFSKTDLGLMLSAPPAGAFDIYFKVPAIPDGSAFAADGETVLGMDASHRLRVASGGAAAELQRWNGTDWAPVADAPAQIALGQVLEIAFPHAALWPTLDTGDALLVRVVVDGGLLPASGPARLLVPDLGRITWVVDVDDPSGDDHGPGAYTYPTDSVFVNGVFDLTNFKIGVDETSLVFRLEFRGPVDNPWGSPNGLAIQTVDIYIDTDGPANGARQLRDARNAALSTEHAWDLALTLSGWGYGAFQPDSPSKADPAIPVTIITDPARRVVLAKIPRAALPGDPTAWAFAVTVLSNDGYGPNGVRDVLPVGERWRVGGGPADSNHTRILDLLWPAGLMPSQQEMLSGYVPSQAPAQELGPDDYPQLQMLMLSQ